MATQRLNDDAAVRSAPSMLRNARIDWGLGRLGRFAIAVLFVDAARWHVSHDGWIKTIADMNARGVPSPEPLLVIAMIMSSALALALLFGFRERWAALGLAIYTISVSLVMYNPFAHLGQMALILFLKDLCIFGALLSLSRAISGRGWPTPAHTADQA